jgi:hypothetical protein
VAAGAVPAGTWVGAPAFSMRATLSSWKNTVRRWRSGRFSVRNWSV